MKSIIFLALRYLAYYRWKTGVLVAAISVILFLPLSLEYVLDHGTERLRARAQATPLVLGAPGSAIELMLSTLYFESGNLAPLKYALIDEIHGTMLGRAIPLQVQYRVGDFPVVGTSPDYFDFRDLKIANGRRLALAGEAVLGALSAKELGISPGDSVITTPDTVFDVTGTYPLKLKVVGLLQPTGTQDDYAVFVDVKTSWIIGGTGHGHEDLARPEASGSVLKRDGKDLVANASVGAFREVTSDNMADFHFHGGVADFPLSAIIVVPRDVKAGVLLEGRYQNPNSSVRVALPSVVIDDLLNTVLTVRQYVLAAITFVGVATLATVALVFSLSIQLRRSEITTMMRIGAAPMRIGVILGTEILLVLAASVFVAGIAMVVVNAWGDALFGWILMAGNL